MRVTTTMMVAAVIGAIAMLCAGGCGDEGGGADEGQCTQGDIVCGDSSDCSCGLSCMKPCPSCDAQCTRSCTSDADCADLEYAVGTTYTCTSFPDGSICN